MNKGDLVAKVHEMATSDEYGIELTKKSTGELIDIIFNTVGEAVKESSRFSTRTSARSRSKSVRRVMVATRAPKRRSGSLPPRRSTSSPLRP